MTWESSDGPIPLGVQVHQTRKTQPVASAVVTQVDASALCAQFVAARGMNPVKRPMGFHSGS